MSRSLASSTPQACDEMNLETLIPYPEQIFTTAEAITRACRDFIDSEKRHFRKEMIGDVFDEQEYLEKKAIDVQSASSEMQSTLKRFMFLSPQSSERRTVRANTDTSEVRSLLTDGEKIAMRQRINQESPI